MAAAKRENEPPSYTLLPLLLLLLLLPPKYIYVCTQEWMLLLLLLLHQCRRDEKEEFGVNVAVISIVPAKKDAPCGAHYNKKPLSPLLFLGDKMCTAGRAKGIKVGVEATTSRESAAVCIGEEEEEKRKRINAAEAEGRRG